MHQEVRAYHESLQPEDQEICKHLFDLIQENLPGSEYKIWHRHPVWFLQGNPIVGYSKLKHCIRLLFWSGQSFEEPDLLPEGSFKAAEVRYTDKGQINADNFKRWLGKASTIQWDYKNIVKRKGALERISIPSS